MKKRKILKLIFVLTAVILLSVFFLVPFHQHEDGQHHADCPLCRFAKDVLGFFLLAAAVLSAFLSRKEFVPFFEDRFPNRLLLPSLQNRPPPVLS